MAVDPPFLILASLASGPKHGYAIMQDIQQMAGVKIGPGTLYGAIPRLEEQGLIEAVQSRDRRRPYRLTSRGAAELREQLEWMHGVSTSGLRRLELGR
jgi:DNA-binding PadR family transcriptional regulator